LIYEKHDAEIPVVDRSEALRVALSGHELRQVAARRKETMTTKIEIYQDKNREWRWRALRSGRIVADSAGDGYKRRSTMMRSLQNFIASLQAFKYVIK